MRVVRSSWHTGMYFVMSEDTAGFKNYQCTEFWQAAEFCAEGTIKIYLSASQIHLVNSEDLALFYTNLNSHEYLPLIFNGRLC